jgi:hypothetical protein
MIMDSGAVQSGAEVQTEAAKPSLRRRRQQQQTAGDSTDPGTAGAGDGRCAHALPSLREDPEEAFESSLYSPAELEYQKHASRKLHQFIEQILAFVDVWPPEKKSSGSQSEHGVQLLRGRPDLSEVDAIRAAAPKPTAEESQKAEQAAMEKVRRTRSSPTPVLLRASIPSSHVGARMYALPYRLGRQQWRQVTAAIVIVTMTLSALHAYARWQCPCQSRLEPQLVQLTQPIRLAASR